MTSFRICTFNTENLLHPGVRFAGRPDHPYTEPEFEDKMAFIRGILREGRCDLVGLQEQFSDLAFQRLAKDAELGFTFAPDIADGKNIRTENGKQVATGPYVALASRFEIVKAESIAEFPQATQGIQLQGTDGDLVTLPLKRFQRPVIRASVKLRDDVVATVFVAHLKSKRPQLLDEESSKDPLLVAIGNTRSLIIRAAESVALRKLVLDATANNDTPVIVLGDLNDDLGAVTTRTVAGEEPYFLLKRPEKEKIWDRLLYSVHDIEEAESYRDVSYSHIFDGRYELLDHIFVSQELVGRNPKHVAAVRNTRIFNDHLVDIRRTDVRENGPSRRSDHGVPVTELSWRE